MTKVETKQIAARVSVAEFDAIEDLSIDLRIRRNSDFVRQAVLEKLEKHGKVIPDADSDN